MEFPDLEGFNFDNLEPDFWDGFQWEAAGPEIEQWLEDQESGNQQTHHAAPDQATAPVNISEGRQPTHEPPESARSNATPQARFAEAPKSQHSMANDVAHGEATPLLHARVLFESQGIDSTPWSTDIDPSGSPAANTAFISKRQMKAPATASSADLALTPVIRGKDIFLPSPSTFVEYDPDSSPRLPEDGQSSETLDKGTPFEQPSQSNDTTPSSIATVQKVKTTNQGGKHVHVALDRTEAAKNYDYGDSTPSVQQARAYLDKNRSFNHGAKVDDPQDCRANIHEFTKKLFSVLTLPWDDAPKDFKDFQVDHYENGQRNALVNIRNRMCTVRECHWAKAQLTIVVDDLIALHERGGIPFRVVWNHEKFNKFAPEPELTCSERLNLVISAAQRNKLIGLALLDNDGVQDIIISPANSLQRRISNAKNNARKGVRLDYAHNNMPKPTRSRPLATPRSCPQDAAQSRTQPKARGAQQKKRPSDAMTETEGSMLQPPPAKKRRGRGDSNFGESGGMGGSQMAQSGPVNQSTHGSDRLVNTRFQFGPFSPTTASTGANANHEFEFGTQHGMSPQHSGSLGYVPQQRAVQRLQHGQVSSVARQCQQTPTQLTAPRSRRPQPVPRTQPRFEYTPGTPGSHLTEGAHSPQTQASSSMYQNGQATLSQPRSAPFGGMTHLQQPEAYTSSPRERAAAPMQFRECHDWDQGEREASRSHYQQVGRQHLANGVAATETQSHNGVSQDLLGYEQPEVEGGAQYGNYNQYDPEQQGGDQML